MKMKIVALIALLAVLAACTPSNPSAGPTTDAVATIVASTMQAVTPLAPPPTSIAVTVPSGVTVNGSAVAYQNVSFLLPTGLASGIRGEMVPRLEGGSAAPWEVGPEYTVITFDNYILGNHFHKPQIYVYPVDEFAAMNEGAALIIEELRTVLGDRGPTLPDSLPHLPIFNAQQLFHAQGLKMDFASGRGIRYLTQYSQAVVRINNNEMFYTFQGLTSDGKYYVAVNMPISTSLIDSMTSPDFNTPGFTEEQWNAYLDGVATTLNSLAPAFFSPSLDLLDAMLQTITIAP